MLFSHELPDCKWRITRYEGCVNVLKEEDGVARKVGNPGLEDSVGHRGVGEVEHGDAETEVAGEGEDQTSLAAAWGAMKQNSSSGRRKSW